jgi:hypothetical protein
VAHSQCSQKTLPIILLIPACSQEIFPSFPSSPWCSNIRSRLEKVVCSQCSQKKIPSFSSSQHVPKRFFHHSLHLFVLLDALMTGLCWKRWCILNVPKKAFPSFSSSQHCPWHSHSESRLKMVEKKNGLKTEEIVRWPGTESTLLLT